MTGSQAKEDSALLGRLRRDIDAIDASLLQLLARRLTLCVSIGDLKERLGMPMMQPSRITDVTERAAQAAASSGLSPQFARDLWHLIILEACRLERIRAGGDTTQSSGL